MSKVYTNASKEQDRISATASHYKTIRCTGCPLRGSCRKAKSERVIQVNHRLNNLKANAGKLLLSEKGLEHRSQRPADVEQTFENLKWNKKFKLFLLRGVEK